MKEGLVRGGEEGGRVGMGEREKECIRREGRTRRVQNI